MKKERWIVTAKKGDFKGLASKYGCDMVTARVLVNRDVKDEAFASFLRPSLSALHDPHLMLDMDRGVSLVKKAISNQEKIRIVGDYDVDGINSTYILYTALKKAGAQVDYAIPHRIEDGYGINEHMVDQAHEEGITFLLTCDNGIAAQPAMERAKEYGMTCVVTDHHAVPYDEDENGNRTERLVPADAIINPHRKDCPYPYKEICGAVVAWKFVQCLYETLGYAEDAYLEYIEEAAFATVCDVMPLVDENRIIVQYGLKKLEHTKNLGLQALLTRTELAGKELNAFHFGFVLGPCFNSSGRLDTADRAIELLLSETEEKAAYHAGELVTLNDERKSMMKKGDDLAYQVIEENHMEEDPVLVVYVPGLHESLAGLVAGHIKERFYRPTLVITDASDGGLKGSGRSIEAYSMYEKLSEVKEYFTKYGGHPMAAGFSLEKEMLPVLREKLIEKANLSEEDLMPKIMIDVATPLRYLSIPLVEELEGLAPFGNGNPAPVFADKNLMVSHYSSMGKEKQFRKITFRLPTGGSMDGIYFGSGEEMDEYLVETFGENEMERARKGQENALKLSVVYEPSINEFRGNRSLQVMIKHYR